jgi:hypothetical protein
MRQRWGCRRWRGMNELIIIDVLTVTKKKRITLRATSAIQQTSQETIYHDSITKYQVARGIQLHCGLFFSLWPYSPLDLGHFLSFLILYVVGRTHWTGDQLIARPLPSHRTTQTQNKGKQTSMPWVGFEPTTTVSERAKTAHTIDPAITVIGPCGLQLISINY